MKEVLTKSFWQGVQKTFYEAMESEPAKEDASQVPAGEHGKPSSPQENSSCPSPRKSEEKIGQ
jgi:hypothetical protein